MYTIFKEQSLPKPQMIRSAHTASGCQSKQELKSERCPSPGEEPESLGHDSVSHHFHQSLGGTALIFSPWPKSGHLSAWHRLYGTKLHLTHTRHTLVRTSKHRNKKTYEVKSLQRVSNQWVCTSAQLLFSVQSSSQSWSCKAAPSPGPLPPLLTVASESKQYRNRSFSTLLSWTLGVF